jgi:hypothetical protein
MYHWHDPEHLENELGHFPSAKSSEPQFSFKKINSTSHFKDYHNGLIFSKIVRNWLKTFCRSKTVSHGSAK